MTEKKIKKFLKEAWKSKEIYQSDDKKFIEGLTNFIYIEKTKSFFFGIVCILLCPVFIVIGIMLLTFLESKGII